MHLEVTQINIYDVLNKLVIFTEKETFTEFKRCTIAKYIDIILANDIDQKSKK